MPCPFAERRGTIVICRVIGRTVNPMVMPCLGRTYDKCRHYREAVTRRREAELVMIWPFPSRRAREREEKKEERLLTRWSREESEKLADPVYRFNIVTRAPVVLVRVISATSVEEVARAISSVPEWAEKCFVASLRSGEKTAYAKFCKGILVATAIEDEAVEPSDVDEFLGSSSKLGLKIRVTLYRSD